MQTLSALKAINRAADALNATIRREGDVYKAELEERLRLGLTGQAAIDHYNDWMRRYGLNHLIVK